MPSASCSRVARGRSQLGSVLAVCGLFLLTGCGGGSDAPRMQVESVSFRQMPALGAKFPAPRGMHFGSDGRLFVLDNAGRVLVLGADGEVERQWMMPEYSVGRPEGIRLFEDGRIGVADTHYHRVVFFDQQGTVTSMHGVEGIGHGEFVYPVCIEEGANGEYFVGEYGASGDRIQKFSADGTWLLQFGGFGLGDGQFQRPSGIAWVEGRVFVADAINNRVQEFTDDGDFVRVLGSTDAMPELQYPYDLADGPDDDLFVIEYGGRLTRLDLEGNVLGVFGSPGRGANQFFTPWGLAVAADGRVAVADTGNRRIVELHR